MAKIDTTTLYRLYVEEQLSIRSIALQLHVAPRTVHDAMMHARIPRRQPWQARAIANAHHSADHPIDEELLLRLYLAEQRSIREIAGLLGICTASVYKALKVWEIPRRKRGRPEKASTRRAIHELLRPSSV